MLIWMENVCKQQRFITSSLLLLFSEIYYSWPEWVCYNYFHFKLAWRWKIPCRSSFSFPYSIINDDGVPETLSKQEDKLGTDIGSDKDNFFCDKMVQERLETLKTCHLSLKLLKQNFSREHGKRIGYFFYNRLLL